MGNNLTFIQEFIKNERQLVKQQKMYNSKSRIIIYYQTLIDLSSLINQVKINSNILTHITLASIHFGFKNNNGKKEPYIHLNDNDPDDNKFDKAYDQLRELKSLGIQVNLLIGGAGTAFNQLFSNYSNFYGLLKNTVKNLDFIDGFNLDIEEGVTIDQMVMLIKDLKADFPNKTIIFAPLGSSLASDQPGMGGFIYKNLIMKLPKNIKIDYFNTQCYGEYSLELYEQMLNNGYKKNEIVMGMLTGQDFDSILVEIKKIKEKYPDFGGVAIWEYFNAPPEAPDKPYEWCVKVSDALQI